jgi:hypothetical protein
MRTALSCPAWFAARRVAADSGYVGNGGTAGIGGKGSIGGEDGGLIFIDRGTDAGRGRLSVDARSAAGLSRESEEPLVLVAVVADRVRLGAELVVEATELTGEGGSVSAAGPARALMRGSELKGA